MLVKSTLQLDKQDIPLPTIIKKYRKFN